MVWGTGCAKPTAASQAAPIDPGRYYAVLLDNNSVYFGKLESLATDYAVLHDVFYVQSNVDQQTKAVSNVLIRRGKEWHGPDRMIINQKAIGSERAVAPAVGCAAGRGRRTLADLNEAAAAAADGPFVDASG